MEFNPPGDAVMQAGDQLVVLGRVDGLRELETAAQAEAVATSAERRDHHGGATAGRQRGGRRDSRGTQAAGRGVPRHDAGRPPGLGIVLAGNDPASEIYVRNKLKSAGDSGIRAELIRVPADGDARRRAGGGRPR